MPRKNTRSRKTVEKGRYFRKHLSLPETLLWTELRGCKHGFKFRRQHRLDPFVLDFFCAEAQLDIEVDSAWHDGRHLVDAERDRALLSHGVCVLRVPASDVLDSPQATATWIEDACREVVTWRSLGQPPGFKSKQFVKYP